MGKGEEYIEKILNSTNILQQLKAKGLILIVYSYTVKRQQDFGSCPVFSLKDLYLLEKVHNYSNIFEYLNQKKGDVHIKSFPDEYLIKNIDVLPLRFIALAQGISLIKKSTEHYESSKDYDILEKEKFQSSFSKHNTYSTEKSINQTAVHKFTKYSGILIKKLDRLYTMI
ncbi:MAG: hypothetical protein H0U27_08305 [Nitrosopumilus sp.]|nr:hypothetical protein [Nitrosopumilus sp.]